MNDRDFNFWLNFFNNEKPPLTKFMNGLNKKDNYFLSHPFNVDFEHELYEKIRPGGFIEKDFQEVLANENPKEIYFKTRIAMVMSKEIDFSLIKKRIGDKNFYSILEKALIDGHYEKYGILFEKLIGIAISKYELERSSLLDVAFLRGVNLGSRYTTEKSEIELKKIIFKNKIKIKMGF